ncbi:MAG: DUF4874 domain-containing protein [Kiritimatiellae bacterium]|nr:DUF4874 domain-containing protein [Kiritimatiellia bacterium]
MIAFDRFSLSLCAAALAFAGAAHGAASPKDYFRPDVSYEDGAETFAGPARGAATGGWVVFKPEGLPNWRGREGYHSSLWELSRFSGGREQNGKRPSKERVGEADIPLTEAMKADVRRFLDETRKAGGTLIVRIGYTWSDQNGCEPADFDVVLGHVRDLSQIMADYDDVVVGVEAGVAGPWAEMHSSDYCKAEYMNRVLETYCDNLSPAISVLVRAPGFVDKFAGTKTEETLALLPFKDARLRRIGMFNDGYLGTWWDYGTWAGAWKRERGVEMLKTFAGHPYGGELAYVSRAWLDGNRERCGDLFDTEKWNIVREWYDTHLSYLRNGADRRHSLCAFIADKTFDSARYACEGLCDLHEYDGLDLHKFMYDHMGWRFVVRDARLPRRLARGKKALAVFEVANTGFGRLLLPARVEVLLDAKGATRVCAAELPRGDLPSIDGGAKVRVPVRFAVPADMDAGTCEFYLRVSCPVKGEEPSAGAPLRPVRLANKGMWRDTLKASAFGPVEVR